MDCKASLCANALQTWTQFILLILWGGTFAYCISSLCPSRSAGPPLPLLWAREADLGGWYQSTPMYSGLWLYLHKKLGAVTPLPPLQIPPCCVAIGWLLQVILSIQLPWPGSGINPSPCSYRPKTGIASPSAIPRYCTLPWSPQNPAHNRSNNPLIVNSPQITPSQCALCFLPRLLTSAFASLLIYRGGNWSLEKLSHLPRVNYLRFEFGSAWIQSPSSSPPHYYIKPEMKSAFTWCLLRAMQCAEPLVPLFHRHSVDNATYYSHFTDKKTEVMKSSLSINNFRFIHVAVYQYFIPFYCWVVFSCTDRP